MQVFTFDLEDDYLLIGIHSTEEDYRLAYLINQHLNTKFVRYKHNLDFENSTIEFPLFEYKDEKTYLNYYLINNKCIQVVDDQYNDGLFGGNYSTTSYLLPEIKKVDFLLKIEGCTSEFILELVDKLNKISEIITSFQIETNTLKSKYNLIF
ncbi:IPExxxVDY family protein [Lutibacter sp. A80]|uniref:IPExxxVDY family protein n=1 Tax=Lutibacter sp. A80 TaxID=2918453 RepID=UPI001F05D1E2|nr:IPExxxVDY family protein [Lutibacter sp. A80]UMB59416.1 IPExxxVDY family protein [Lutibacter sp. A80]